MIQMKLNVKILKFDHRAGRSAPPAASSTLALGSRPTANHDANMIRSGQWLIWSIVLAVVFAGSVLSALGQQRGRPQLNAARTTFVADNGQPLRGPYTSTEWTSAAPADQIANMRNLGFNAVHLYAEVFSPNWPASGNAPGYNVAQVDAIVQRTRDAGLYLVMTIGNGANNGNHNIQWATNFWNFYAGRYANETHVIYEIHNEPMAWGPSYLTGTTPAGTMNMEIAAYRAIRANAPHTPVLLFSYAVLAGSGGANAALTDIQAFNQAIFGVQNAVWTNEAVAFHGYGGWEGTATAVNNLINAGYPCFMTEFGWPRWGRNRGVALELELTSDLERLGVSWLTFQYIPPSGVSDPVTVPDLYKELVDKSGLGWTPDYGTWPVARGVYGNNGQARSTVANWVNNFLTGTVRIQAEDFDWGGEGVSYHDTTATNSSGLYRPAEAVDLSACNDTGGGFKVSEIQDGEWLEYSILVRQPGYYDLALRYATPNSGGVVEATSAIAGVTARRTLAPTGSHTTWATATVPVYLAYGRQLLRLQIPTGGFDLNWIELSPTTTGLLANGTYKFLNAATALAMEGVPGTNRVVVTNDSGALLQRWNVQHVGGGQYRVVSVANNSSWNASSDVLALVSSWNTSKERCYLILPESGGFHRLLPVSSGLSLHGPTANGAIVEQQEQSASVNQLWAILPPTTPAFPAGLSAAALSATQVALQWQAVPGAVSYNVKRSASSGGPYATVATGITATTYTDTLDAAIKFYYVVTALTGGLESPNSVEASVNPPYPWQSQDIGTVGLSGSVNFNNGVFTVGGSGADIWGTADGFRFVYLPVNGNFTITARVLSVQNTDQWAKAGVMIRSSLTANSANAFVAVTPGNGVTWQYRTSNGGNTGNNAMGGLSAPYWVRLVRSGSTFTAFRSPNGVTWTQQGSPQSITMGTTVYVGLALTSHNNSSLCTATFDNVSLPGWQNVLPPPAPASLTATPANGEANLVWSASAGASSYNVRRALTDGGPYTFLTNVSTTTYTDASLSNGVAHYYVVSALNIAGESANSVQASVPAQFLAPTGLAATPTSSTNVQLVWNAFTDATNYHVKRSFASGGPYATVATGIVPTEFTDTTPAGIKPYYVVSAIANGVESQNSAEATFDLPYPWATQDVGAAGFAGSATINNGLFAVAGSGADIWDTADAFRFLYVPVTGNCVITARVLAVQNTDPWAKAGVMIRESLNANSANALVAVTPGNGVTFQYRSTTGGTSGFNNTTALNAPYWVRLVRSGNTFTAYRSPNGVTWTQQGTPQTFAMSATVYVGLALTSHNNSSLGTATFDNVTAPGWTDAAPPSAPASLVGLAGNAQAVLSWTASPGAASYNVKRASTDGGPYSIVANVTATNHTDLNLTNGTAYYYVVSALNQAGQSGNSTQASVTPEAFAVTGLAAVTVSASQIDLTWNALDDATSYHVKRALLNGGPYTTVGSGITTTNFQDSGLAAGTIYHYVVSAMLPGGETPDSVSVTATTFSGSVGTLVHRYRFNESGGSTIADSVGGPIWNGTLPSGGGLAGGTLALASSSHQYGTLPAGITSSLTNLTVMAWLNLTSLSDWSRIFEFGHNFSTNMYLMARSGLTGKLQFGITTNGSGAEQQIGSSAGLTAGTWHQVAVTLSSGVGVLYLDGMAVGTNANLTLSPASLGTTSINYIGKSQYAVPSLNGTLDEFRIYNAALSREEIAATAALGPNELLSLNNPLLSVTATPGSVVLSWPLANAGFTLQSRTNLFLGDWENVTSPAPQIVGEQWQVELPASIEPATFFYRLMK
jgi:endoglucanase